jgi:hypothetical protein
MPQHVKIFFIGFALVQDIDRYIHYGLTRVGAKDFLVRKKKKRNHRGAKLESLCSYIFVSLDLCRKINA